MEISLIAALDKRGVIGADGRVPWRLPADMRWFKFQTIGKPVIMGRKTYESIGRPLPDRRNIILTRQRTYRAVGCVVVHSKDAALAAGSDSSEVMVIGGGEIYDVFLGEASRLYLTFVDLDAEGDVMFPVLDQEEWREVSRQYYEADKQNSFGYSFVILERRE